MSAAASVPKPPILFTHLPIPMFWILAKAVSQRRAMVTLPKKREFSASRAKPGSPDVSEHA